MNLRLLTGSEQSMPTVVSDCEQCDGEFHIGMNEVKISRPIKCGSCNHSRHLSYREFTEINARFAYDFIRFIGRKQGAESR